jgi:hypothetical protein
VGFKKGELLGGLRKNEKRKKREENFAFKQLFPTPVKEVS